MAFPRAPPSPSTAAASSRPAAPRPAVAGCRAVGPGTQLSRRLCRTERNTHGATSPITRPTTMGATRPPPRARNSTAERDRDADVDEQPLGGADRQAGGLEPQVDAVGEVAPLHHLADELDRGAGDEVVAEPGGLLLGGDPGGLPPGQRVDGQAAQHLVAGTLGPGERAEGGRADHRERKEDAGQPDHHHRGIDQRPGRRVGRAAVALGARGRGGRATPARRDRGRRSGGGARGRGHWRRWPGTSTRSCPSSGTGRALPLARAGSPPSRPAGAARGLDGDHVLQMSPPRRRTPPARSLGGRAPVCSPTRPGCWRG